MSDDKNRFDSIQKKFIGSSIPSEEHAFINASTLEGKTLENLKLLKGLMQGEKVRLDLFINPNDPPGASKNKVVENLKNKIVEQFSNYEVHELANLKIPKKYLDIGLELLSRGWRDKIHREFPQTLTFRKVLFSRQSFRSFMTGLALNTSLKALKLESCHLKEDEIKLIGVFIKIHPSIVYLHLDNNAIDDDGLYFICQGIKENEKLSHLSLIENEITDRGARYLQALLPLHPLSSLYLEKNPISLKALDDLKSVAREKNCYISFNE